MNGFASSVLSMLLGWLRTFLTNLWNLLGSDDGNSFLVFLQDNWKIIFLFLCVGGFVLDRLIYFFRWRPDILWRGRLNRLREKKQKPQKHSPSVSPNMETDDFFFQNVPAHHETREPILTSLSPCVQDPRTHFPSSASIPHAAYDIPEALKQNTANDTGTPDFAPAIKVPSSHPVFTPASFEETEPVFDDPETSWSFSDFQNPASDLYASFGVAQPEPSLEALYEPSVPPIVPIQPSHTAAPAVDPYVPVHPGLNAEILQQNIGLGDANSLDSFSNEPFFKPMPDFPDNSFVPFYQKQQETETHPKRNPLATFAKKARNLVTPVDEKDPPSIHDLQPRVDIKSAFHPPVMPQQSHFDEE